MAEDKVKESDVRAELLSRRRRRTPEVKPKSVEEKVDAVQESPTVGELPRSVGRDRTAEAVATAVEGTNFIVTLARHLGDGHALKVYVDPKDEDIVRVELIKGSGALVPTRKRLGSEYYMHIHNPEFWTWEHKWKALSQEEKIEYATTLGVTWVIHDDSKINNMRLTEAVRLFEKVEKYKPEYDTVKQRKVAKEKYLAGQLDISDSAE